MGLDWDGETIIVGNRVMSIVDTLNPGILNIQPLMVNEHLRFSQMEI